MGNIVLRTVLVQYDSAKNYRYFKKIRLINRPKYCYILRNNLLAVGFTRLMGSVAFSRRTFMTSLFQKFNQRKINELNTKRLNIRQPKPEMERNR